MFLLHSEGTYVPLPSMTSIPAIPAGIYEFRFVEINGGRSIALVDIHQSMLMEPILKIDNDTFNLIVDYVTTFQESKDRYELLQIAYRTGILLYGKEGTGKTMIARSIALMLKERGYITIFLKGIDDLTAVPPMIRWIRHGMPDQLFCVVMDEFEAYIQRSEQDVLRFLDGGESQDGIVTIAITNHRSAVSPRMIRPSRFGLVREVPSLDTTVIMEFIKEKLKNLPEGEKETMYKFMMQFDNDDGHTIDEVKDAIIKHFILGTQFQHADFDVNEIRKTI